MDKKVGFISAVEGVVSSIVGIIGVTCVICASVCEGVGVVGAINYY